MAAQIAIKLRRIRRRRYLNMRKRNSTTRPGYGVVIHGSKQPYSTDRLTHHYNLLRSDSTWFNSIVHMISSYFDALHELVVGEIKTSLVPYNGLSQEQRLSMRRKKKKPNL